MCLRVFLIELAIPHRLKRGPFADATINMEKVEQDMEELASEWGSGDEAQEDASGEQTPVKKKASP